MRRWLLPFVLCTLALISGPVRADLEVNVRQDKIILIDGTEIACLILVITERAVLVVEADPEDPEIRKQRTIPRRVIQRIIRGENEGVTEGLQTEDAQGRKLISGVGFREDVDSSKSKDKLAKGKDTKDAKGAPKSVDKASDKTAKKEPRPAGPVGPGKKDIVFAGKAAQLAAEGVAGTIKGSPKDMAEAYLQRFPALREASQSFLGADRLPQSFEQIQKGDGQTRSQAESFLRVFMGSDTSALGQVMTTGGAPAPGRPQRGERGPRRGANKPAAP